jgi:DNA polymerase (family 10)
MPSRRPSNAEVAKALRELALFLEMDEVPFKPQAFEKAAYAVTAVDRPLAEIHAEGGEQALAELPGIGKGIAARIGELIETGRMRDLEAFRKRTPIDVLELTAVEGIGPRKARALWKALGVRTVADLAAAAKQGRIRGIPRFGERSERKIGEAVAFHQEAAGRRPLGEVLEIAHRIEAALSGVRGVAQVAVAGSIRRHRETIGDVDVLVVAREPERAADAFASLPDVQAVMARGPTKVMVRLSNGMDADLRVLAPESFGAALLYFTGSKAHNVALRKVAQGKGLKLNEYGLFRGERAIAGRTEEEVYEALGMGWIPPEMREDSGEVELALEGRLPAVVEPGDIRGDLQVHTRWTDGLATVEAMARAARKLGREYLVITDHTRDLAMTGGLDEGRLREQVAEIREVDRRLGGIRVLAGVEVNIRPDGSLDLDGEALAPLDLVGAAVHSHFDLPRAEMTRRLLRAVEDPNVDVLFHPLARAIGHRRPIDVDFDAVLRACLRTGTVLEIDAQPERLDLPDALVRKAVEAGARIAIDSDAHTQDELRYVETFGVGVARRGWAGRGQVLTALPAEEMLASLRRGNGRATPPTASSARRTRRRSRERQPGSSGPPAGRPSRRR